MMFRGHDIKIKSKEALNTIEKVLQEVDGVLKGKSQSLANSAIIGVLSTSAVKGTILVPNVGVVLAWNLLSNGIAILQSIINDLKHDLDVSNRRVL